MMIINLMKKLIEKVEVAVKVAKILIEKKNQQKPKCNCDFFFPFKFCTWESTTTEESHIRCGADHGIALVFRKMFSLIPFC